MHAIHESVAKAMVDYHKPIRRPERRPVRRRPIGRRGQGVHPESPPDKAA